MRSRFAAAAATIPLLAGAMFVASSESASADPGGGAVVIKDQGCVLYDAEGTLVDAESDLSVVTKKGRALITCKATVSPPSSGEPVRYDYASTGEQCELYTGQETTIWREIISPSGQAKLVCHFRS